MAENRAPRAGGREFAGGMRQRRTRRKVCNFCANKVETIDFMVTATTMVTTVMAVITTITNHIMIPTSI